MTRHSCGALTIAMIAALLLGAGTAAAQTGGGHAERVYQSSNPAGCVVARSTELVATTGSTFSMSGTAWVETQCFETLSQSVSMPDGNVAVRLKLWKWNGTSSEVCVEYPEWIFNHGRSVGFTHVVTFGCGDGQYNLATDGCAWVDGAWHCGTSFSGWFNFDVTIHRWC